MRAAGLIAVLVLLVGGGIAAAVRLGAGAGPATVALGPDLPSEVAPAPRPLPEVRAAARSIERLDVPGGRALLARSPVRSDRVLLLAHGRGSAAGTVFARPTRAAWTTALLRGGWSIATADAGGDAWGDDGSVRDYRALLARLRERGLERVAVGGISMGGLASLQLLRVVRPVAWVGVYPVYDLGAIFRLGRFAASIRAAYGFRGDTLPAAAQRRAPVALPPLQGLPMIVWASPGDTVVPKAANADRLADAAAVAGARVTAVTTRGDHGDPSNYDARTLLRFLDEAAALPGTTSARRGAPSRRGRRAGGRPRAGSR